MTVSSDNHKPQERKKDDLVIEVKNLMKRYGKFIAVNDISLSVKRGEVFGFLGPNGAGKTTTISILLGLARADKGTCFVLGKDSSKFDETLYNKIGVVFEEKNLYMRLSGFQNLKFFADMYGVPKKRVSYFLNKFDLEEAGDRQVKNYSKGMKQRLLICRALLNDPDLLILDEPTGGLDPLSLVIIHDSIKEFKSLGKTVFVSTHYMEEADSLCDRLAFINQGKIIALSSPEELKNRFGEELLEIKFDHKANKQSGNEYSIENKIEKIKSFLHKDDTFLMEEENSSILLSLNTSDWGKRLDQIRDLIEINSLHSREATLHDVFIKLATK